VLNAAFQAMLQLAHDPKVSQSQDPRIVKYADNVIAIAIHARARFNGR
jgi:hypothetical protein